MCGGGPDTRGHQAACASDNEGVGVDLFCPSAEFEIRSQFHFVHHTKWSMHILGVYKPSPPLTFYLGLPQLFFPSLFLLFFVCN